MLTYYRTKALPKHGALDCIESQYNCSHSLAHIDDDEEDDPKLEQSSVLGQFEFLEIWDVIRFQAD